MLKLITIKLVFLTIFTTIISNLFKVSINDYVAYFDLINHFINFYKLFKKGGIIMNKSNNFGDCTGANGVGTRKILTSFCVLY